MFDLRSKILLLFSAEINLKFIISSNQIYYCDSLFQALTELVINKINRCYVINWKDEVKGFLELF